MRLVNVVSLLAWVWLAARGIEAAVPGRESLGEFVQRAQYRQAYGVYLDGHKVGWAIDELRLGRLKGVKAALLTTEMRLRLQSGGENANSDGTESDWYSLAGDGSLLAARVRQNEGGSETLRRVQRKGDQILITTRAAGVKNVRRAPLPKENLALGQALAHWLQGPPKPGERFETWSTEWTEDNLDRRETYTYKGTGSFAYGGTNLQVCVVDLNQDGMELECLLLPNGQMVKGKMGGLFELRAEPEAMARDLSRVTPVDYQKLLAIKVDQDLGVASRVDALTLEVSGLDGFAMPAAPRQVVKPQTDGRALVELRRDVPAHPAQPLSAPERRRWLAATASVQADDKAIAALSRRLLQGETEPVAAAARLVAWLQKNLRQVPTANATTAREVLRAKVGDCTEHSLLFVALARAGGIPAREVAGVAFARGTPPSFYWHEWAEIHDGHRWVSIDPTWNEIRVDATHVKFSDDLQDWSWINLLGRVRFKVLAVEKH